MDEDGHCPMAHSASNSFNRLSHGSSTAGFTLGSRRAHAMHNNKSSVGPRGWAILTLVGGAALASLFLRPPQTQQTNHLNDSAASRPAWPGRLASAQLSGEHTAKRPLEVSELVSQLDAAPMDAIQGSRLPTPQLPAWATPPSPLDHLISQGTAPPWNHAPPTQPLEPVGTWFNGPNSTGKSLSTQSPEREGRDVPRDVPADVPPQATASYAADPRMPPPWPSPQPWGAVAVGSAEVQPGLGNPNSQSQQVFPPPTRPVTSLAGAARDWPRVSHPSSVTATPTGTQAALQPFGTQALGESQPIPPTAQTSPAGPAQRPAQFVFQPGYGGP